MSSTDPIDRDECDEIHLASSCERECLIVNKKYETSTIAAEERSQGKEVIVGSDDGDMTRILHEVCRDIEGDCLQRVYMLFSEGSSLWQLQTFGLPDNLLQKADVIATTMEDILAKSLLLRHPGHTASYPLLDRVPQSFDSNQTVHLVIFGSTAMAEALAINAALIAHYPNYCRNSQLRTRITIIDNNVVMLRNRMLLNYHSLFDHSYYRTIDLDDSEPRFTLHHPLYEGKRDDFVDVEWEFVRGDASYDAVRQKLTEWAASDRQQLSVAVCTSDFGYNAAVSAAMPEALNTKNIPIVFHVQNSSLFSHVAQPNLFPFSDDICHLSSLRMLNRMAMCVNYVYNYSFSLNPDTDTLTPTEIDINQARFQWTQLTSFSKRYSNMLNAMTLGVKLHSAGLTIDDWRMYYALSKDEIDLLAQVEHNRWTVEELILGYRPVTDEEQAMVENDIKLKKELRNRKIHYDLRSFNDLRADSTGKNVGIYDIALTQALPLIVKTCITD